MTMFICERNNVHLATTVKKSNGIEYLSCDDCHCRMVYVRDESCSLFQYKVYQCPKCKRYANNSKHFPRKVSE